MKRLGENSIWQIADCSESFLLENLTRAMGQAHVAVVVADFDSRVKIAANLHAIWTQPQEKGDMTLPLIFGEEDARRILDAASQGLKTNNTKSFDIQKGELTFEFSIEADEAESLVRVTILDVTEERRREKLLRTLLREVSHRSKNLLAIIQSIASQTARKSVNLEVFLNKFRGRLFSLAESQDLVTASNWQGSDFFSLAKGQFKRYVSEGGDPIRITGDNVQLSPNESLHIGLALHELVVNATSHGALSHGSPTIALTSRRVEEDGQPMIEIVWQEAFGKNTANNDLESFSEIERRFGSRVLESAVPAAIGGVAEYEILPGEVAYRLTFPEHGDAEE